MKHLLLAAGLLLALGAQAQAQVVLTPAQVNALTKDYATWYSYAYYHVPLTRDFKALDQAGRPITKKTFLQQLVTGKVVALANVGASLQPVYQLYAYAGKDAQLRSVSQQLAQAALFFVDQVGKPLPAFHFTDLQGNSYTPASTRGKVLVVKCWFIHCVACVKEFPEVNALAATYRSNKEVLFLSLATDEATPLRKFLQQQPLQYAVIPHTREYIQSKRSCA
ncbi:TlpA family protein disulfide reductase [Hymenobacter sp. RP-2-7]|uniref:TlpA family protein disulfide reductase n=1 Tax=Hymenobacter polaris TaxID=2682546 RepID=A0A7Y0AIK3_9BACT|nr:TlpA disulfide reductase family protein [Hymenobacter polaris]NML67944.1 TlpA family protein disulfide reductase [Hymenobacter polaris]